jgi:multiple sugar transport system ATP-binding protein
MSSVSFKNVHKAYGKVKVLHGIGFDIADGEFVVLVGPSGCGKSTLLRMLAGLEEITGGEIAIGNVVVNDLESKDRDIAMVFQSYALYPHMTVRDNMGFSLRLRNADPKTTQERVANAARILNLEALLDRFPRELSGGQRQRVAMGRAIVRDPKVFLFDEPLSNLDAKLRGQMRIEIARLHRRLGTTSLYVTHDQVEAMTMGDRICVMKDGRIMQVATPLELYNKPENVFVAGFIGSPPMNFFKGRLQKSTTSAGLLEFVETNDKAAPVRVTLDAALSAKGAAHAGKEIIFGIRPEDVLDTATSTAPNPAHTTEVKVEVSEPMGAETYLYLTSGVTNFIARVRPTDRFDVGQLVKVTFKMEAAHLFDPATEQVLK